MLRFTSVNPSLSLSGAEGGAGSTRDELAPEVSPLKEDEGSKPFAEKVGDDADAGTESPEATMPFSTALVPFPFFLFFLFDFFDGSKSPSSVVAVGAAEPDPAATSEAPAGNSTGPGTGASAVASPSSFTSTGAFFFFPFFPTSVNPSSSSAAEVKGLETGSRVSSETEGMLKASNGVDTKAGRDARDTFARRALLRLPRSRLGDRGQEHTRTRQSGVLLQTFCWFCYFFWGFFSSFLGSQQRGVFGRTGILHGGGRGHRFRLGRLLLALVLLALSHRVCASSVCPLNQRGREGSATIEVSEDGLIDIYIVSVAGKRELRDTHPRTVS